MEREAVLSNGVVIGHLVSDSKPSSQLKTPPRKRKSGSQHCAAIKCCKNRIANPYTSFFRFPRDEKRCRRWVRNTRRKDLLDKSALQLNVGYVLCASHFEASQFRNQRLKNRLVWNAQPTLFDVPNPPKKIGVLPSILPRPTSEPPTPRLFLHEKTLFDCMDEQSQTEPSSVSMTFDDLKKEFLQLCKKFEELKEFAKINVDLLLLSVDSKDCPEVRDDLYKIQRLVQAFTKEDESCSRNWNDIQEKGPIKNGKSLDEHLTELVSVFTQAEVISAFFRFFQNSGGEKSVGPPQQEVTGLDKENHLKDSTKVNGISNCQQTNQFAHESVVKDGQNFEMQKEGLPSSENSKDTSLEGNLHQEDASENDNDATVTVSNTNKTADIKKISSPGFSEQYHGDIQDAKIIKRNNEECDSKSPNQKQILQGMNFSEHLNHTMRRHMCHFCGKQFRLKKSMNHHIRFVHFNERKKYICDICGKSVSRASNLSRHKQLHTEEKTYQCSFCDKAFTTSASLNWHIKNHKGNLDNWCSLCNRGFQAPCYLRQHNESKHFLEKKYSCHLCERSFSSDDWLHIHMERKHGDSENREDTPKVKNRKITSKVKNRKITSKVKGQKKLDKSNSNKCVYNCPVCRFKAQHISFALHLLSGHGRDLNRCLLCEDNSETFDSFENLKLHLTDVHLNKKPFKCSICGEAFHTIHKLLTHKALHRDKNALKCSVCGKTFACVNYLKLHQLYKHELVKLECKVCGKKLSSRYSLTRHTNIHSKSKMHVCSICGRSFGSRSNLTSHMWTHSTKKRYKCEQCDQGFSDSRNLRRHFNKCHKKQS